MSHIEFLRSVATSLMSSPVNPQVEEAEVVQADNEATPVAIKRGPRGKVPEEFRFDASKQHFLEKLVSRLRCAVCQQLCSFKCGACSNVLGQPLPLHTECCVVYHSK